MWSPSTTRPVAIAKMQSRSWYPARYRRGAWLVTGVLLLLIIGLALDYTELTGTRRLWTGSNRYDSIGDGQWALQDDVQDPLPVSSRGRILITGGGGNIGKPLIRRLLSSHTHITVVDLIFHQDEIDAIHNDIPVASSHLRIIEGDIRDGGVLDEAMTKDITGVIHLAAVSRVGWCLENEPDCEDVNVRGTDIVLEAIERKRIKAWFVQASSREVYGNAESFPVSEDAPNIPANAYGRTKSDAEAVIKSHSTPAILLRLSNVYGGLADHRERLIPAIVSSALSHRTIQMVGGNQDLDMVHIDDVVHAFLLSVGRLERGGIDSIEAYNIGTGTSASAMEIIQKVLALTNSSSPLQIIPGDSRFPDHYIGTTSKATTDLGFTAQVGVDEGLVRLVSAFYRDTLSFVDRQLSTSCSPRPAYSTRDLARLDGCTGTVGVNGPGGMEYLSTATNDNNLRTWKWLDTDEVQLWKFNVEAKGSDHAVISFTQESGREKVEFQATREGHLFGVQSRFEARVNSISGHVSLSFEGSETELVPDHMLDQSLDVRYRLTPFCCPGKPSPWPFYEEDPLASAITDTRLGTHRYFNASQSQTLCDRLSAAKRVAEHRLQGLEAISPPFKLDLADLPSGQPYQWRSRGLDHCTNLCDHPTTCLDTGDCACASSACVPRIRYPFTAFANVTGLSFPPPTINWDEVETNDPLILIRKVASSSWLNVLRPHARRYLQSTPNWPAVHLTSLPDDVQVNRDTNWGDFDKLQSTPHGCFSADSVMERGIKLLNQDYTSDSLVFMPYYAGTQMMPPVEPWIENALTRHLPADFDSTRLIVPFTFDWGVCNTVLHDLWRVRDWSSVNERMERISSWQPMGDLNSPCYRIDQDVVIPARTCLQDRLRERFGDLSRVLPSRKRSILVAFKGSFNGAGSGLRHKLMCDRAGPKSSRLTGGDRLQRYWNEFKPGGDYLETIGDTIFCPVPAGTTGWATRTIDVVYAGCIPVLLGDQTQHAFWDTLDWTKFSVTIPENQINQLEEILLSYSWLEILHLQTNLALIRNAFLYPTEPDMRVNLEERGPFYFALHSTALLRKTRFPTRDRV